MELEIPDFIMEMITKVISEKPELNHVAVRTDGHGGWQMDYFKQRDGAEKLVEGRKQGTYEIVDVED